MVFACRTILLGLLHYKAQLPTQPLTAPSQGSQMSLQAVGGLLLESGSLTSRGTDCRGGRKCRDCTEKGIPQIGQHLGSVNRTHVEVKATSAETSCLS